MKTAKLTGAALNWAVAKCEGVTEGKDSAWYYDRRNAYNYSTNWSQGGPIIERLRINLKATSTGGWAASCHPETADNVVHNHGPTPLIAAMRCYVTSKLGAEVEIPEELT